MRVSSRHLILTSPVFQTMLDGPFKEGTICESGRQIITRTWDVEAMTIILNIIHGRHREVPRSLSLETLAKLAVVVDYYEFHEVVEVFVDVWLNTSTKDLPTAYGKESTLWLLVSWVFGQAEIFETMTRLAMKHSTNEIAMIDLPIPGEILGEFCDHRLFILLISLAGKIDEKRQEALSLTFNSLYGLLDTLCDESPCSYECSSMLLGSLSKELKRYGILSPRVTKTFSGHSVKTVMNMAKGFRPLTWTPSVGFRVYHGHSCSIIAQIEPALEEIEGGLQGLKLEDYQRPMNRKANL
ncbi:hypothetical protein BGZ61DRAFT_462586 [Ilyonectria robusta]|uniref:uncharacterized protein n=1 Tax=Ilyonectria robusta TaxID=1079257 RepID=UPI001E8D0440|nr:uncharacterized protein BGZ61DRAFT_462586 [Ilyonectria robusta]KAH8663761.1 hypothetical protein BGZ61DRAFT_462586 [Ilyonectria robusta]